MNGNFTARIGARITEFMARMRQVQNTIRTTANDVRVDIGADVSQFNRRMAEIRARIASLIRERVVIKIEARIEEFQNKINRIATNIRAFGELMQHTLMGTMMAVFPAIAPILANVAVAIANLGPMIGTVAGSTFALAGAFVAAGAAAVAFGAVAIPTIKDLFNETGPPFTALQKKAWNSFESVKKTYRSLVKETETPVLQAFTSAMQATDSILNKLRPLFNTSAQAVANLMAQLNTAIESPPIQQFLDYLNASGAPMLETFGRSFGNVFKGLLSMLTAFAPLSVSTAKGFEEMTARFAEWANGLSSSAKFQAFIDYVNTNMPKIRAIFRDAIAGVVYFFSAFAGSSSGMMDGLVSMMARFKEWSSTLSQNQGFQQFIAFVQQSAPSVMTLIGNLITFLVNLGIGMAPLGAAIINIANKFLEFANSLMENNRSIGVIIAGLISFGGILLTIVPNIIAFGTLFKGLGTAMTSGLGKAFKFIKPLFTNFGATIARISASVLPKLGTAIGLITNPVTLVIAAIAGLIAVFVGLYRTNETFRSQVQTVWEAIKTGISIAVTAVKDLIMSVWSQITTFWAENQANIMSTASTVWNVIGTVVTSVMSAIGAIMQFIWPVVKALIISTWDAIKNVIQGAINVILGIIKTFSSLFSGDWQGVWDGVKQILGGALQAVWGVINLYFIGKLLGPLKAFGSTAKTLLQGVWTTIKGIFTNTLNTIKSTVTTIFNGMKTTIETIWKGVKTFFDTVLNGIKSIFTSVWKSIASFLDNFFTSLSGTIRTVWNGIKSFFSSVLNAIANIIKSIWNGIKSTISSILNGIKTVIETIWNGFKTTVSTAMDNVKTAVVNGWNAAKSFLEGISLVKIGEFIVAGLVTGINNWFGKVKAKVMELAELLPEWLRNKLGIHSPSRVMIAIAKWIPIGVAKGIESTTDVVKNAVNKMTQKTIPDFSETLSITKKMILQTKQIVNNALKETNSEALAIQKEYDAKRAELSKKTDAKIQEIKAKAADKGKSLTAAQERQITKIMEDAKVSREKLALAESKELEKIKSKTQKETFNALKDFADKQIGLEKWSTKQQAEYWQYATKQFKDGTDERIQAQINYNKAMSELTKEKFETEKYFIDRVKKYGQMSLTQELEAYEKYVKQYKAGSEERIYYEDKVAETKQAIHEKLMALNDEFTGKMQETNQKLIDGTRELNKEYEDALNSRSSSLYSFMGIFDEMEEKAEVSGQKLIDNLKGQNAAFKDWAANVQSLASKGIDEGLLAELQAMGPSAAAEISALNSLSTSQLTEYVSLWKEKSSLARTQAETELTGMKAKTEQQINELHTKTQEQLTKYEKEWAEQIKEVRTGTENQFNALVAKMPQVGANVIRGMQKGLSDMTPALMAQAQGIANSIKATIESALAIHSPSRWGKKMIGHNLVKGIIIGLADMKQDAIKAAAEVAEWVKPAIDVSDIINDISGVIDAIQSEIEHKVKVDVEVKGNGGEVKGNIVHQEVNLHSPKHLSPSENARQLKRVAQQIIY
ncbi:hypothetical protein ACQKNX_02350 [Lysinibacillus sp. NPDC093712]|uniref:phage tail protein n=1 Tax=Lysinibacillus sp. NPDC093712 TaxID=3390579 RepID=UPI003D0905D0